MKAVDGRKLKGGRLLAGRLVLGGRIFGDPLTDLDERSPHGAPRATAAWHRLARRRSAPCTRANVVCLSVE